MTEASSVLTPWCNFAVMSGSAAAALTGLMFVVITLVMGEGRVRRSPDGIATFSTPTVVHFGAALLTSAILCAPWRALLHPAVSLGLIGLAGIAYLTRVAHRTTQLSVYRPDLEDWIWYTVLPFIAYAAVTAGAAALLSIPVNALFAVAGGIVVLMAVGIHNAWDVVTYIAVSDPGDPQSSPSEEGEASP